MSRPQPSPTSALLCRHGQSAWNALGRWQGQADPPLSDLGRKQAHEAARAVGVVDAIWASDLRRAAETAAIISHDIGVGPVVLDADLRERDAGEWTGLTRDEIDRRYPGFLADGRRPEGWEPDDQLVHRARAVLGRIAAADVENVLVVTHGGLVMAVERHFGVNDGRLANVAGRRVTLVSRDEVRLGDRLVLAEPQDVTVPHQE